MPRFTKHAYLRYFQRHPGLLLGATSMADIEQRAQAALQKTRFVSRAEACQKVGRIAVHERKTYYRTADDDHGVWISCWHKGEERIITYLYPDSVEVRFRHVVRRVRSIWTVPQRQLYLALKRLNEKEEKVRLRKLHRKQRRLKTAPVQNVSPSRVRCNL